MTTARIRSPTYLRSQSSTIDFAPSNFTPTPNRHLITIAAPHRRHRSNTSLIPTMATANHRPTPALAHVTASLPLLVLTLVLVTPRCVDAQPSQTPYGNGPYSGYNVKINPTIAALIIAFICGFFFLGFFSVYLRQCSSGSSSGTRPSGVVESGAVSRRTVRRGINPEVLASFPTMAYSEAKEHKKGNDALECAVCLSEFADEDTLRLLPRCSHVFHVDCIDIWLDTHVTCPVCRANLAEPAAACESTPAEESGAMEEGDLEAGRPSVGYRRWHSTGHEGEEVDRYTLRLPEDIRREIFTAAGLRRAASVAEPRVRRVASGSRVYRGGWSGRWGFLLRTFSVRRRADGTAVEGSSKRVYPSVEAPLDLVLGGGGGKPEPTKEGTKEKEAVVTESSSSSSSATSSAMERV